MFYKLGPHIIAETQRAREWASTAPIALEMDGINAIALAPAGATTIFRKYFPQQPIQRNGADAAYEILGDLHGFRPTYAVIYNEEAQTLGNGLERYVEFTREAVDVLHGAGVAVAGFSFSTGNPGEADWRYIKDHDFAGVDALSVHEYFGDAGFTLDHALRHRRVHEWLNRHHPPIVITECGRDAVEGGAPGWTISGVSAQEYINELLEYDALLCEDHYVIGGTVFTAGETPRWDAFGMDDLVPAILGTGPLPGPAIPAWLVLGSVAIVAAGMIYILSQPHEGEEVEVIEVMELEEDEPVPPGWDEV
jgi:hypothetical protein